MPVLLLHGDDDQVVPIANSALLGIKFLKYGSLKVYPGYPHGMATTHAEDINHDILAFILGEQVGEAGATVPSLVAEPIPVGRVVEHALNELLDGAAGLVPQVVGNLTLFEPGGVEQVLEL